MSTLDKINTLSKIIALSKINKEIIDRIESVKGSEVITKICNKLIYTKENEQPFSIVVQKEIMEGWYILFWVFSDVFSQQTK